MAFTDYKVCKFIVKTVKNTNVTRFQKKLVRISKNITKENWKCAICLTERTYSWNWRQIWSKK